jgi:hypothetical protein
VFRAPTPPDRLRRVPVLAGFAGLVVLVVGTFQPWLRTGRATRNSYQATGLARRLLAPEGIVADLFRVWPLIGLGCALTIAAYVLGLRAVGLLFAAMVSIMAGGAAFGALSAPPNAYASVIDSGPLVTLAGAVIVLIATAAHAVLSWTGRRNGRTFDDATARGPSEPR